jgi:hypothetical protein
MDNSQKEKNGGTSNVFVNTTFLAFNALVARLGATASTFSACLANS